MGGYNSKKFSKVFSERTEKNLDYIIKVVNRDEKEQEYREEFLKKYQSIIDEVTAIITSLRNDAKAIPSTQKKGKNMLKKQIYSIADKLNKNKSNLEGQL